MLQAAVASQWSCQQCMYMNPGGLRRCEKCNAKRSSNQAQSNADDSTSAVPKSLTGFIRQETGRKKHYDGGDNDTENTIMKHYDPGDNYNAKHHEKKAINSKGLSTEHRYGTGTGSKHIKNKAMKRKGLSTEHRYDIDKGSKHIKKKAMKRKGLSTGSKHIKKKKNKAATASKKHKHQRVPEDDEECLEPANHSKGYDINNENSDALKALFGECRELESEMAEKEYYYLDNKGIVIGPVTIQQLKNKYIFNKIDDNTEIWGAFELRSGAKPLKEHRKIHLILKTTKQQKEQKERNDSYKSDEIGGAMYDASNKQGCCSKCIVL